MDIEDPPGFSVESVAGHADSYSNRSARSEGQEAGSLTGVCGVAWVENSRKADS